MTVSDFITIIGFSITLLGFAATLWQIHETKSVAKSASDSARLTSNRINQIFTLSNLSKYTQLIKLIIENIYDKKFLNAADKLSDIRDVLIEIKNNSTALKHTDSNSLDLYINNLNSDMSSLRQLSRGQDVNIDIKGLETRIDQIHVVLKTVESKMKQETSYAQ